MTDYLDTLEGEQFIEAFDSEGEGDSFGLDAEEFDSLDELDLFDGLDESDPESDAFFKKAFRAAGRALKKGGFLRKLAPIAGKVAGGLIGGPAGAKIGGMLGGMLREDEGFADGEAFDFEEFDLEEESGDGEEAILQEDEAQAYGLDAVDDSLAEELAALAADSESDAEASSLLGGVTIHIVAPAPVTVKRVSPTIVKSTARLGTYLRRSRRTRQLVRTIPTIQRRAVKLLTKHAERGKRVTPVVARKAMAKATYKTLRSPRAAAKGVANNVVKRRRLQRINRKAIARAER